MTRVSLRLRAATDADEPLLFEVYAASRAAEMAQTSWTPEQQFAFVAMQHRAQAAAYRERHPDGRFLVVERDGTGIGRLYLARLDGGELRVLDIALLPAWCGKGIGSALLRAVFAFADAEHSMVSLHVEAWNPAMRLYARLGFVEAARNDVYVRMERAAAVAATGPIS